MYNLFHKISSIIFSIFILLLPFQVWHVVITPVQPGMILFAGWASLVLFILIITDLFFFRKDNIRTSFTDFAFFLFLLYLFFHSLFIRPISYHPFAVIEYIVIILVYLLVRIQEEKSLYWIFTTLVVAAFAQSVWGVLQQFSILSSQHSEFKITGPFFNPAPFSGYLVALLPVVLGCLLYCSKCKSTKQKSLFLFVLMPVLCVLVFVLVLANSRTAWLAGTGSTVYLLIIWGRSGNFSFQINKIYFLNRFQNLRFRKLTVFGFSALLVVAIALKLYDIRPNSANGRLLVWKSTAQIIADNPITGVGAGQFKANYMHYQAEYLLDKYNSEEALLADNTIFAFNEFIRLTCELGVPGLLLALFLLFVIFVTEHTDNLSLIIAKSGLVSILFFSLFSYPSSILPIKVLFVFYMAIVANMQKQFIVTMPIKAVTKGSLKIFVVAISVTVVCVYSQNLNKIAIACNTWEKASTKFTVKKLDATLELCKKAYPDLKTDAFFMAMYSDVLMREQNYYKAESILTVAANLLPSSTVYMRLGDCYLQQEQFQKAEKAYRYALQMIPSRIKPVYKLAKLYFNTGREEKALCEIENYLGQAKMKRTIASYEIELQMMELKEEIENYLKQKREEKPKNE